MLLYNEGISPTPEKILKSAQQLKNEQASFDDAAKSSIQIKTGMEVCVMIEEDHPQQRSDSGMRGNDGLDPVNSRLTTK